MSLLPQHFLKSIVLIKGEKSQGTGFLYGIKLQKVSQEGLNHYAYFLVTNRHIANLDKPLTIKFNKIESGSGEISIPHDALWIFPEEAGIDLAILQLNYNFFIEQNISYQVITIENSIISEIEFMSELEAGQEIFLAGFPLGISGIQKNFPIVRQGIIARNDEELQEKGLFLLGCK